MTADLNAAANQLTADIMAEVEASEWLRGRERAAVVAALRDAASDAQLVLMNEIGSGHTTTYSVRRWLNERADRIGAAS